MSHPANWGPFKIDLLRHALDLAALRSVTLVTEPVAAAMHYASTERIEPGSVVAVYDLGGGTFDAAVLKKTATGFATLGEPEGIERLGGIDFDEAVMAHVRTALHGKLEELDGHDPAVRAAFGRLRQECVAAKEALSFDSDTSISVLLPNIQTDIRLTRTEFEPMIRAAIGETIDALRRAIERAGVGADDLTAVLLVGGSSQIPLVAELVSNALGRPVAVDTHPKHSIAMGAAIAAATTVDERDDDGGARELAAVVSLAPAPAPTPPPAATATPVAAAPPAAPPVPPAVPPTPTPVPAAAGGRPPKHSRTSRRTLFAAIAAAILVIGGVVLGVSLLGSDPSTAGQPPVTADAPTTPSTTPGTGAPATDCRSESGRCAFITDIALDGDRIVADYETVDFDPLIFEAGKTGTPDDHHVHFFFNTTSPENAGSNGNPPGVWFIWDRAAGGGELRFDDLTRDQAGDASQLCVRVSDSSHAVEADSGNCVDLP